MISSIPTLVFLSLLLSIFLVPLSCQVVPGKLNPFHFSRPEGNREIYVYVPSTYDSSRLWPLTFYFHGYQGDWQQGVTLNMTLDAEAAGYLIAFGQGTSASPGGPLGWNAGACCIGQNVDDVTFTRTALKVISAATNVDPKRVYSMGWSNGGMMTERLGCEATDLFAGLAPDASAVILGQGGDAGLHQCDQSFGSSAVNYLHFHGTGDTVVPWTGTQGGLVFPGALEDISRWVTRLGCDATVESTFNDGTFSNIVWPNCRSNSTVELMTVRNGQHQWWTKNQGNFDTAAYVMDFFTRTYQRQNRITDMKNNKRTVKIS